MADKEVIAQAPSSQEDASARDVRWRVFVPLGAIVSLHLLLLRPWYLFDRPYWHDEAWVVIADRAPLSQLGLTTGVSPIGWTFLMTIVPGRGDQHQRLLPLVFSVGAVIVAYLLARDLLGSRLSGAVTGSFTAVAVAVAPLALARQDLKQYTADAFFALLVLWLVVRLETVWSARRLRMLVIVAVSASLVSYASMFVTAAVMTSLVVVNVVSGDRRKLIQSLIAGGITAAIFLAVVGLVVVPHLSDSLTSYWNDFYLDGDAGLWALTKVIWSRLDGLAPLLGFRWPLLIGLLVITGVIAMRRRNFPVAALAIPILWLEMVFMGIFEKYPFLDQRTSHFLLILTIAVAGIGVESLFSSVSLRSSSLATGLLLLAFGMVLWQSSAFVGSRSFPHDEVRAQTRYVENNYESGDVVLVNALSGKGFAYYWPDQPTFFPTDRFLSGFSVRFDQTNIVLAEGRSSSDIEKAFAAALRSASLRDSTGIIWLVRFYMTESELAAWQSVMDRSDLSIRKLEGAPESLTLITKITD